MEYLIPHIESLIFTAGEPIPFQEIKLCLEQAFDQIFSEAVILEAIEALKGRYQEDTFAIEIIEIAGGYQFLTKGAYFNTIGIYLKQTTKKRLSQAALETLSIIAYRQPVSKGDLERIRGVSCDYSIQKLLEKELVTIAGRSEGPGKPLLYGTSSKFMDYFGIKNLSDLPQPKDFKVEENTIGEQAPIEEEQE